MFKFKMIKESNINEILLFIFLTIYITFILVSYKVNASNPERQVTPIISDFEKDRYSEIVSSVTWAKRNFEIVKVECIKIENERIRQEELKRLEAERLEALRQEALRLEAERQEALRLEAERQEALRIEAEKAEALRIQQEKIEQERILLEEKNNSKKYLGNFVVTGYNLSVGSCGKEKSHPQYGITASGYSLRGMSREQAMTVAVDKSVIPLGTKIYLEFGNGYSHLNGVYTARDTGVKGNHIDVFMGEEMSDSEVRQKIGKRYVDVYLYM